MAQINKKMIVWSLLTHPVHWGLKMFVFYHNSYNIILHDKLEKSAVFNKNNSFDVFL